MEPRLCKICETRKPRRYCPGTTGDICAPCCGTEREQTIHCPLDCEYLLEARRHEKPEYADPASFPNQDIQVSEDFLREHSDLLTFFAVTLLAASLENPSAVDSDVREAMESAVKTYRTMQSGLIYQSRPANPLAAHIADRMLGSVEELRKRETERTGLQTVRDADVLGVFVFLERMGIQWNSGKRLSRAFVHFLLTYFPPQAQPQQPASGLIV